MGRKSVASRAAREVARRKLGKSSIGDIYKKKLLSKYPECAGISPDCPNKIENIKNPPEICHKCPHFLESNYYDKPLASQKIQELHDLFASMIKQKQEVNMD